MRGFWRLISPNRRKPSKQDRRAIPRVSHPDDPLKSQDRHIKHFRELEHAIKTGRAVTFSYLSKSNEEGRWRVFPKRLFRRKDVIYCQAFDTHSEENKNFRLERMSNLKIDLRERHIR
jgi:predicted DNA-binding transcriptional regulator YafY